MAVTSSPATPGRLTTPPRAAARAPQRRPVLRPGPAGPAPDSSRRSGAPLGPVERRRVRGFVPYELLYGTVVLGTELSMNDVDETIEAGALKRYAYCLVNPTTDAIDPPPASPHRPRRACRGSSSLRVLPH